MSPLPQRKKTAEEIAKLRESFGHPGLAPVAPPPEDSPESPAPPEPELEPPPPVAPAPVAPLSPPAAAPAAEVADAPAESWPALAPGQAPAEVPGTAPRSRKKRVRSLRRSERIPSPEAPAAPSAASGSSFLPSRRHSDRELAEISRREAFSIKSPAIQLKAMTAHPGLLAAGYLFTLAAPVLPFFGYWYSLPALCAILSLAIAVFIFIRKRRSTHHAGFMTAISILTIVFGALYYFPQLRHAP